jgi:acyl-CoA thioesterase
MASRAAHDFDVATASSRRGPGHFIAELDPGWNGGAGPHGGYLAATVVRAMQSHVDDPGRPVRALTCHYLSAMASGEVDLLVETRKQGRSVSFVTAEIRQGDRTCLLATATFAVSGPALLDYDGSRAPEAVFSASLPRLALPMLPSIFDRVDLRPAIEDAQDRCRAGGWVQFVTPRAVDAAAVCLFADVWLPAPAARLGVVPAAPTLTYTVLFRQGIPAASEPVLLELTSQCSRDGLFEEDGAIWTEDGVLLAQSRQLALLR